MAIDTAKKRMSALVDPWGVLPLPDGIIDTSDRGTLLGQYSGIATTSTSTIPPALDTDAEFRFYSSAGKRIAFKQKWIDAVDFELLERGGFGQGTVHALLTWEEMSLDGGERLDVYLFGQLMYRGYVRIPHIAIGSQQEARLTLYGLMEHLNGYQAHCRYAYGDRVDLSRVFEDMVGDHVTKSDRLPNVLVDAQEIGVTIDRFDGTGKNVAQAINALCDIAPNQCVWGFDVNDAGQDRIYLRPRGATVTHRYSIGGNAVSFDYPRDLGEIVNTVHLTGGNVSQPNLITDGSFENPLPNGETNGNLLGDYSFEAGSGGATLSGGATRKGPGDHGGARTGSYWVELDTTGEKATWPDTAIDRSIPLVASFWARREDAAIARGVRMYVQGLDAGASHVIGFYVPSSGVYTDPGSDTYVRYSESIDFTPYPTVTQVRVSVETNGGSAADDGVDVDDVALYEKTASPGAWTYALNGSATRAQLEWQQKTLPGGDDEPYHGCYAVLAQAAGISVGTDWMEIVTAPESRISVRPNNPYSFVVFVRGQDLSTSFSIALVIREYKADGTLNVTTVGSTITDTVVGWTVEQASVTTASDTASVSVAVRLKGNNPVYIDAAWFGYGSVPAELLGVAGNGGYWEGDTYERVADVENPSLTDLDAAALDSINDYGVREAAVSVESVVDWETAKTFLSDYFNAHATPAIRGTLRIIPDNANELLEIDGTVKLLNLPSGTAPDPLFPTRVRYRIADTGVDIEADLGNERPDMADLLTLTAQRARQGL